MKGLDSSKVGSNSIGLYVDRCGVVEEGESEAKEEEDCIHLH